MKRSLQAQLSLALTAAILVVALGAGGFGFVTAYRDSIRSQDDLLMQVGALLKHSGAALSLEAADPAQQSGLRVRLLIPGA
ncbi:hypothetical protein [Herbaspirillum seropedicae]|uniref:hypothetical protein n=1 Tax=Herbaspirillum seropedicae TaxID=964 RepID=UPI001FCF909C|nr:hypothetical protein [Herbaspirillum seropedicae]